MRLSGSALGYEWEKTWRSRKVAGHFQGLRQFIRFLGRRPGQEKSRQGQHAIMVWMPPGRRPRPPALFWAKHKPDHLSNTRGGAPR